jgi:hypothetical protein
MTEAELREQLQAVTAERNKYHAELTDLRLKNIEEVQLDHEARLRSVETIGTRFNTLYAMFAGNGILSIIALVKLFAIP